MKNFLIITTVLGLVFFLSCKTRQNVVLTSKSKSDTIKIHKKDTLTISLVSNASTGYKWHYDDNSDVVKLIKMESKAPEDKNMMGAAGKQIFIFKAVKKGNAEIKLYYTRGTVDTAQVYTKQILVE